jgi:type IX secretion system PorP/SprF family membrane protein
VRKTLIPLVILFFNLCTEAQDIHFSQTDQTPLMLNPASAGLYNGYYRGILNYKNQWSGMGKPYSTFMGSYDMPFENKWNPYGAYFGLGIYVFADKAGDAGFSTTQGDVAASCIVPIGDYSRLSTGLDAGVTFRSVNIGDIRWPNQYNGSSYDPNLPSNEESNLGSFFYLDLAAGVNYQYLNSGSNFHGRDMTCLTVGAALFNATKLFYNTEHVYPRIVVRSDLRYDIKGSRVGLVPSLLFMLQGPAYEADAGFLLRIKTNSETNFTGFNTESAISAGLMYRYKDAIVPQLFFEIAGFGFGLSYDVNISSLSRSVNYNGGFEVSVRYSKMKGALYKNKY